MARRRPRVLILVENLSVPFDRRVWQEATALHGAGCEVHVICPQGKTTDRELFVELEGIRIHRYRLREARDGALAYLREYAVAIARTSAIARRLSREAPFDVVHACNPPDLFFLVARALRRQGTRFVFDHHDLVPELYRSRGGSPSRFVLAMLSALERRTFRTADLVISTNESYRRIAIERGGVAPDRVHVVRSAPDLRRFVAGRETPALRRGRRHLVLYLGVMGFQDGVDHALEALAHLRASGRDDFSATFIGDGPAFESCVLRARELGLDDVVEFTGRVPGEGRTDEDLACYLATASVGLVPDPYSALNDVSTMNKVVEYLTMGVPVVGFDLCETRVSAGECGVYATSGDDRALASCLADLLDDEPRRRRMAEAGRRRARTDLSWDVSRRNLIAAYADLLGSRALDLVEDPAGANLGPATLEPAVSEL